MRIAIVSKSDEHGGGASRVAVQLAEGMIKRGHDVHHWHTYSGKSHREYARNLNGNWTSFGVRVARKLARKAGYPDMLPFEYLPFGLLGKLNQYDIVHFHDLSSVASPLTVYLASRKVPVLWTFHDCAAFTGGCLYPMDCQRFKAACGECPQLGNWPLSSSRDSTRLAKKIREFVFSNGRLETAAPSRWMVETAMSSGMLLREPICLPNGVDCSIFKPSDKEKIRSSLNLPKDQPLVLLASGDISDFRKGTHDAISILKRVQDLNAVAVVMGKMDEETRQSFSELKIFETGYIQDEKKKAEYFSACDVLLICSLADNLPLVVLEAMACGLPIVGYATGGIPEMVQNGENGALVGMGDLDLATNKIREVLASADRKNWGESSRRIAEETFNLDLIIEKHEQIYQSIIDGRKAS